MPDALLMLAVVLSLLACIGIIVLLVRRPAVPEPVDLSEPLERLRSLMDMQGRLERAVTDQLAGARKEAADGHGTLRAEVSTRLTAFGDSSAAAAKALRDELRVATQQFSESASGSIVNLGKQTGERLTTFGDQLKHAVDSLDKRFADLRAVVEDRLKHLQAENALRLDEMRKTVDEKLQGTLERRLTESFKQVSERLEQVHKGLGEMQALSSGVTDLRRVMTNVKARGTWGEWQLGALLEQLLAPSQFEKNVRTKERGGEAVEFAIRMPGQGNDEPLWLPIDSKFPVEDYQRLLTASDAADAPAVAEAGAALEARVKGCARDIRDKYINPPRTTDYAVLFLPTESLYAEVLRRPGLAEALQRDLRVIVCGPTTLAALVNSLQVGFRTMAIQKRSGEVFKLLGAVKTQFEQFGDTLKAVRKKIGEAGDKIDEATKRTEMIGRKLKDVESTPALDGVQAAEPPVLDEPGARVLSAGPDRR